MRKNELTLIQCINMRDSLAKYMIQFEYGDLGEKLSESCVSLSLIIIGGICLLCIFKRITRSIEYEKKTI